MINESCYNISGDLQDCINTINEIGLEKGKIKKYGKSNDIPFKYEEYNGKFNLRVAALIEKKDKELLQKAKNDNYFSIIGVELVLVKILQML